jgi:hypothetical protein
MFMKNQSNAGNGVNRDLLSTRKTALWRATRTSRNGFSLQE